MEEKADIPRPLRPAVWALHPFIAMQVACFISALFLWVLIIPTEEESSFLGVGDGSGNVQEQLIVNPYSELEQTTDLCSGMLKEHYSLKPKFLN
jgi:hypothetical protein